MIFDKNKFSGFIIVIKVLIYRGKFDIFALLSKFKTLTTMGCQTRGQRRERRQMELFVRDLFQTMPLSSLTQTIVRDFYMLVLKKKQMTDPQSEALKSVVIMAARVQKKKVLRDSRSKVLSFLLYF